MSRMHPGLPNAAERATTRSEILDRLQRIDDDPDARGRTLALEAGFRERVETYVNGSSGNYKKFADLSTSPLVLLIVARIQESTHLEDIEADIRVSKLYSSIETSAGKMVEAVVLPLYGWSTTKSAMATAVSIIDGIMIPPKGGALRVATLKSGPRCLNDTMAERYADDVLAYADEWASSTGRTDIEFTFGTLYGTQGRSNKKDWHILRHLVAKATADSDAVVVTRADGRWECAVHTKQGTTIRAEVRIGSDWWHYLGADLAADAEMEVMVALIRACVTPASMAAPGATLHLPEFTELADMLRVPTSFNVSLLQRSQLPWLFLTARHSYDRLG